jgi:hypothetical protein
MSTLDDITKEKQRRGARARRCSAREAHQSAQRIGGDRACARALQQRHAGKKDGLNQNAHHSNTGRRSNATTRAPSHHDRKTNRRRTHVAEPRRSDSCPRNRQDPAGNRGGMHGRSREPCRHCDCPTQAGWPHPRARREALRHALERNGATRVGLTPSERELSGRRAPYAAEIQLLPARSRLGSCLFEEASCEWLSSNRRGTIAPCLCDA